MREGEEVKGKGRRMRDKGMREGGRQGKGKKEGGKDEEWRKRGRRGREREEGGSGKLSRMVTVSFLPGTC